MLRKLAVLMAAAGIAAPPLAYGECHCAEQQRKQAGAESFCCSNGVAAKPSCCQHAEDQSSVDSTSCCDKTGGCKCPGCTGARPESPRIVPSAIGKNLKVELSPIILFVADPPAPRAGRLASDANSRPSPGEFSLGIRPQAVLCVWII